MDLLAAFDKVDQDLLINVLHRKFGITNTALKWYNNFLKPRKSRVCINGSYSSEQIMDFGLPQGSTQGAFLFNCYGSTLSKIVPDTLTLNGFVDNQSIRRPLNEIQPTPPKSIEHYQKTTPLPSWKNPCKTSKPG